MFRKIIRLVLPLIIVAVGIVVSAKVVKSKPTITKTVPTVEPPVVEAIKVATENYIVSLEATGTVIAAKEVDISSELAGKVTFRSPQLEVGGRIKKGSLLFKLDQRDYELAVSQEQTRVNQAELELQLEEGRRDIAAAEWEMLGDDRPAEDAALALRVPQLETVKQKIQAAQSGLERAKLNLERTKIYAPFAAMVVSENIERGQVVGPGAPIAKLVGTRAFWVRASIPVEKISQIFIPGINAKKGSEVDVYQILSTGRDIVRQGRVLRIAGPLDQENKTAQILIEVKNPLLSKDGQLPLLPGAFVEVAIRGKTIKDGIRIPRSVVYDGDTVWIVDTTDTISPKKLQIVWRDATNLIVTSGVSPGNIIVKTKLAMPIVGTRVTVKKAEAETETETEAKKAGAE